MATAFVYARKSWMSLFTLVVALTAVAIGVIALATMPSAGAAHAPTATPTATVAVSTGAHPNIVDGCQRTALFKRC